MKAFAIAAIVALLAATASAAEPAGQVKTAQGAVQVQRGGAVVALAAGADLFAEDEIVTKADGSVGLILKDDTTLALGPNSRLVIDRMIFQPAADQLDMGLSFKSGTFQVTAGQIAKLAPAQTVLRTPSAVMGIRGTTFLVEVNDGQ